jgi:phosphatidylinositol alpha-1,6-mannosyltransferase
MILISTQCFHPITGGIENLMYNLALNLSVSGYEVKVFADSAKGDNKHDLNQPFDVARFSGFKPIRRRKKAFNVQKQMIQNNVLICDSWKSLEFISPNSNVQIICLSYGTELPNKPTQKKLHRISSALSKANKIIAISRYTASRLTPFLNNQNNIQIINPGLSRPSSPGPIELNYVKNQLAGSGPVLVSVGRLEKRKGFDTIIKILPHLLHDFPKLVYVVIGEGSQKSFLKKLSYDLGISKKVKILGYQETLLRNAWLKQSDIFVLPARQEKNDVEGFGIVFIEAGWFCIPSVTGNTGGACEAVINGETGLVCNGESQASVLECIRKLLGDTALRSQMGKKARDRARSLLWENVIEDYVKLIEGNLMDQ